MKALIEPLLELDSYQKLLNAIRTKNTPVLATGVIDVQQTQMIYGMSTHLNRPTLILTYSEVRAKEICEDMSFFRRDTCFYPAKDILFYSADVRSKEITRQRLQVVDSLLRGEEPIIVLSAEALLNRLPKKEVFEGFVLHLHTGDRIDREKLMKKLIFMGYERTELVEAPGQFAARGGILDLFSPTTENAIRIEFWDDEIDSIRFMDAFSQRSVEKTEEVRLFPMRELVYEDADTEKAAAAILKEYKAAVKNYEKKGLLEEKQRLEQSVGFAVERLREEKTFSGVDNYISYFYKDTVSLLDYLPSDTVLYFDEPEHIRQHMHTLYADYKESVKGRMEKGYILPSQSSLLFDYDHILGEAKDFAQVVLTTLPHKISDFAIKEILSFSVKSTAAFQKRLDMFCDEIDYLKKNKYRVILLAGAKMRCERLVRELEERGIEASFVPDLDRTAEKGTVLVATGKLSHGFQYHVINLAVFSDKEFFGEGAVKKKAKKKKKGAAIESFTDLKIGDYVVHDNHGIGIFCGLEKISMNGINKDYMKISYANGGNLFVPVNQMDMIQKYIGSNSAAPKLNKLGGQEWNHAKTKVRSAVKILAEDLVALYAKRRAAKGFFYSTDNLWQREFEEAFPFEETEDQLSAIEDVKRDMESNKVMDRLICGDVGYGKTEVAIRAAFKAVQDGKQVAYLVPTTILAQQHYNTFTQRMSDYPVKIELLSRFRTAKQQKEAIKNMEKGFSDIVIGTHRILSKDVKFKDLGMVIVDEEQRFGVSHKEKLKALKENVDVLTLTATPIPRTLHMSLSGIRDMSVLEEPPQERHPIQTYVMESDFEFVKEAVNRELSRGGQVYYLYNRVEHIAEEAGKLQKLVPDARVAYAHGQMTERELENIMEDFIEGEIDVLVCTTIIETGMDISNVNTIIIQDADRMGLSQLYQLRGRVGRSNRIAYAYLMYRRDKVLQEVAEKRLQTIREFTEFGSGFKIAMRDLEIRGAGNLLGSEQHGHMEAVGYDMYCRLLEEEVRQLRGEDVEESFETTIDININAFIPEFFIKNQEQRMEMYKKIAAVTTMEEYYDIQEEMEDRYGNLPKAVQTLLEIALLKAEAHGMDIVSISQKQDNLVVVFKNNARIDPLRLTKLITEQKNKYLFTAGANPYLTIKMNKKGNLLVMDYIKNLLQGLKD